MAHQTWTLFDQTQDLHAGDTQKYGQHQLTASLLTHSSGLARGVETVDIDNGKFRLRVVPTRGMSIWKAHCRTDDNTLEPIDWKSPIRGPVHPSLVPISEPSGLGWLDGFDELWVRCGLESNGAPEFDDNDRLQYPLHGRIGNKPAFKLELSIDDDKGELTLTGWVEETRFHFLKAQLKSTIRMKLNEPGFDVEDEILNLSASPAEIQMLYHINVGHPLLDGGSQILAPFKEVVPRNPHAATGIEHWQSYAPEAAGFEEQVYFATLHSDDDHQTAALLKNAHSTRGVQLQFNTQQLPCFTVWKNTTSTDDGFVTGLEPGTNYPNPRSFEAQRGRVVRLEGNASTTLQLGFRYCDSSEAVDQAEASIASLQKSPAKVHPQPLAEWCSD